MGRSVPIESPETTAAAHALEIGTMATWLTMIAACLVATVAMKRSVMGTTKPEIPAAVAGFTEITMSEQFGSIKEAALDAGTPEAAVEESPELPAEPPPPEMPEINELQPLPVVPGLPAAKPAANHENRPPAPARGTRPHPSATKSASRPAAAGNPAVATKSGEGKPGLSSSQRLSGGSTPKPRYPAAARSRGQTGTVVVEFVVGENGRVVSVRAKNPSPWPLLNNAALDAVRGWRFPPGGMTTYSRPIIFNLN